MKEAYWGWWLVTLGIFIVVIMLLVQNITKNNTEDSYNVEEIAEAALIDAVDYAYYRDYGELKINKEKFMDSFLMRFADTVSSTEEYTIRFTGIYETPPKASVEVISKTQHYNVTTDSEQFDITNRIDSILEFE